MRAIERAAECYIRMEQCSPEETVRRIVLAFLEAFDGEWGREVLDENEDYDTTNVDRTWRILSALRAQAGEPHD